MKIIPILLCTTVVSFSSLGAIVEWGAAITNGFSLENGANLPDDNFIRVGAFNIADTVIIQNATNVPFLFANFVEFGRARIGDNLDNIPGHFASVSNANSGSTGLNVVGRQIYVWAFASTNNTTPEDSLATWTQHGIYYIEMSADPDWAFPVEEPVPQNTTIDLSDLTETANSSALRSAARVPTASWT